VASSVASATKIHTLANKASQQCSDLMGAIANKQEWSWANTDSVLSPIRQHRHEVDRVKSSNEFWAHFGLSATKNVQQTLQRKCSSERIIADAAGIDGKKLEEASQKLQKECNKLVGMQQARCSAE
jgi:hypothetical protein